MNHRIAAVIAATCCAGTAQMLFDSRSTRSKAATLVAGTCVLHVSVADTPARRATGLSDTDTPPGDGLLLRWDRPGLHAIWMQGMRYPLDLAWLDDDGIVRAIVEGAPPCVAEPCEIYAPAGAASSSSVLEVESGRLAACGVRVHERVTLTAPPEAGTR